MFTPLVLTEYKPVTLILGSRVCDAQSVVERATDYSQSCIY